MEGETPSPADSVAPAPQGGGRAPLHWLLEGLFIVASVVLGFAISEYGEYRDEQALAARMLVGIRTEVEHNRAVLEPFIPLHRAWRDAIQRLDASAGVETGVDVFMAARPALPAETRMNVPLFRRAAWDTALSAGGLRLIDYDLAAALSEIYGMQDYAATPFTGLFSQPGFYDPAGRAATIKLAQTAMAEMTWAEETLLALYDKHLPAIRAAQ